MDSTTPHGSPTFSVLIPTCNRPELLAKCLETVSGDSDTDAEVIVSDDGECGVPQALKLRFPAVTFLKGPRRGPAANRNLAAGAAHGEWLAFIDDDCTARPGWLDAFHEATQTAGKDMVLEGRTVSEARPARLLEFSPENLTGGYLWSCNFAIRRSQFDAVGGFDEGFPYPHMEDVDLRERLLEAGATLEFVSKAEVFHPRRIDIPSFRKGRWAASDIYNSAKRGEILPLRTLLERWLRHYWNRWKNPGTFTERLRFLMGCAANVSVTITHYPFWRRKYPARKKPAQREK